MRVRTIAIAACILVAGCAASRTGALPASQTASATPSAAPLAADEAEIHVTSVLDISASARQEEEVVCRREAPTGSRIPVTRCYAANPVETAESMALDEQLRHDLEETRRQRQLLLEQQRMQSALGGHQL
jgi:hypothetical protein